jgi:hypothetical protein
MIMLNFKALLPDRAFTQVSQSTQIPRNCRNAEGRDPCAWARFDSKHESLAKDLAEAHETFTQFITRLTFDSTVC